MGNLENTPAQFAEMWTSWHDKVGAPMKDDYARMVGIANEGAKELGFTDTGAMWRSGYDMPPEEFAKLTEKIWQDMKPLYVALHTYVRWKLNEKYGDAVQPKTGPIRADLLGNMWAQEWGNIYPLVAPAGTGDLGYDIGDLLTAQGKTPLDMVKAGEIQLVYTTVDETRTAIADSRSIRTAALAHRVTYYTTMAGSEAATEALKHQDDLAVVSLQELHAELH